jgi:penicillin-binding protein 1A
MTDLLQTAVNTGTARAAQIGRPVAGKTGTTSSNKDGWFLGFSSGLTTGVWMGRDDAKSIPGLQGGRSPAQAFSAFMQTALRTRPVQNFETDVTLPEWQIEPDEEAYYGDPDQQFGNEAGASPDEGGMTPPPEEGVATPPEEAGPQPLLPPRRAPAPPPVNDNRRQQQSEDSVVDSVLRDLRAQGQQGHPPH